jgi:hypothetical protein
MKIFNAKAQRYRGRKAFMVKRATVTGYSVAIDIILYRRNSASSAPLHLCVGSSI